MCLISLSKLYLNVLRLVGTKTFLTVHTFKHCNKLHLINIQRYCISFRDTKYNQCNIRAIREHKEKDTISQHI